MSRAELLNPPLPTPVPPAARPVVPPDPTTWRGGNAARGSGGPGGSGERDGRSGPVRFTREAFRRMDEAGWFADLRVQLLEGQVVVTPMGPRHCAGISLACEAMERIFERGRFYVRCQLSLPVDRFSEPFPDVAVVPGGPRDYIDRHPTTALLVVEVSDSTLGEDREKARLYAKAGVPEYWIVNLNDRTLEVRRKPVKGRRRKGAAPFAELAVLTAADTVRPVSSPRGSPALAVADLLP